MNSGSERKWWGGNQAFSIVRGFFILVSSTQGVDMLRILKEAASEQTGWNQEQKREISSGMK